MPVGQKLEDARKKKGISLREVSESTKIRGDYISAIETGNFEINLPEVYLRGFVRLYSKFLGLDEDAMVDELNIELGKTNDKGSKKSLGSIVTQDNKSVGKSNVASTAYPGTSSNRSSLKASQKTNTILILATIGVFSVIAVFVTIYLLSDNSNVNPADIDPPKSISEKKDPPNSTLTQNHILKISLLGNVDKLIVCDEGKSPNIFHEFDSLTEGWSKELSFNKSFRCYSSNIENIIFSVDDGQPSKVGGDRKGIGTFNWKKEN